MPRDHAPDITKRFLQVRSEVIESRICRNKTEFAKTVGEHAQNFTKMEQGQRSPTLDQIARVCLKFGYSANWLVLNFGPKKLEDKPEPSFDERLLNIEKQLSKLNRIVTKQFEGRE